MDSQSETQNFLQLGHQRPYQFNNYLWHMQPLESYSAAISELCGTHFVTSLYVFGSVLTPSFNATSDIDLVVRFEGVVPMEYFNNYMDFKEKLELIFGRKVDLIEEQAVKNPIFRKILDRDMQQLYERKAA